MRELNLGSNNIKVAGAKAIANDIKSYEINKLEILNLKDNYVYAEGNNLKRLNLSRIISRTMEVKQ